MRQLKNGKWLLASLGLLLIDGCRDSVPPKIEVCIGDSIGGADCVEADGSKKYRLPSELINYWMTSEPDEANFSSWCYDTSLKNAQNGMQSIKKQIQP